MKNIRHILLTLWCLAYMALAADVTLAWDANPETDIAGYELSYGVEAGKHTSTTPTTATQYTLPDMAEGQTYFFVVRAKNQAGQLSPPSTEITYTIPKPPLNGWAIKHVSDEQADGYGAELAIDGDPATLWHTTWRDGQERKPFPHEIQIDLGSVKTLSGFTHLPRDDGWTDGDTRAFDFCLSLDGVAWGEPVASGEFAEGKQLSTIHFPARAARYFKFVAKSEVQGRNATAVAELSVIESTSSSPPSAPQSLRVVIEIRIK